MEYSVLISTNVSVKVIFVPHTQERNPESSCVRELVLFKII